MPCYHPLTGIWYGNFTKTGKKEIKIIPDTDPVYTLEGLRAKETFPIPCGKCLGCRLDYSRSWADRMFLEYLDNGKQAVFVTLTYDDDHLKYGVPNEQTGEVYGTLDVRDWQLFMKKLRDHYKDRKLRFYAGFEYGPKTHRPHVHFILFGIGLSDFDDKIPWKANKLGQMWYKCPSLAKIWDNGYVLLADVTYKTMAYVSRYVMKKAYGKEDNKCKERGQKPEFSLMSRKPGIGLPYMFHHPEVMDFVSIPISDPDPLECFEIRLPKAFIRELGRFPTFVSPNPLYDKEKYDKITCERRTLSQNALRNRLLETQKMTMAILAQDEEDRVHKVKRILSERTEATDFEGVEDFDDGYEF